DFLCQHRACGRHIDQISPGRCAVKDISAVKIHFFHILRESYDGNDSIPVLHTVRDRIMEHSPLADHIFHFCLCARVNMDFISLLHEIADHGSSHDPNSDKPDLSHQSALFSTTSPCFL